MKLDELKELNRRLTGLLDDPQPGLMSWCEALNTVMTEMVDGWMGPKVRYDRVVPSSLNFERLTKEEVIDLMNKYFQNQTGDGKHREDARCQD